MSIANDRGKLVLEALVQISRMEDGIEMRKVATAALVAIGVIRLIPVEEPQVKLQ